MGRLIDTDTAYEALTEYYNHHTDVQHQALEEALNMVETADAIPVPWIEKYIADCGVDGTVTMLSAKAVNTMLEVWREEQKDARNHNNGVL